MGEFEVAAADQVEQLGEEVTYSVVRPAGKMDASTLQRAETVTVITLGASGSALKAVIGNAQRAGSPSSAGSVQARVFSFAKADLKIGGVGVVPQNGDRVTAGGLVYTVGAVESGNKNAMWEVSGSVKQ